MSVIDEIVDSSTDWRALTHEAVLQRVTDALRRAGFERVRYYQQAIEHVPGLPLTPRLYLTWDESGDRPHELPIGYSLTLSETSVGAEADNGTYRPVMDNAELDDPRPWVRELKLLGRRWLSTFVRHRNATLGLLCLDWQGPAITWNERKLRVMTLLGNILGFQLEATSPATEKILERRLREVYVASPGGAVVSAIASAQDTLKIESVAVFKYGWARNTLQQEWHRDLHSSHGPPLQEAPYGIGQYLTGKAWTDVDYHQVLEFKNIRQYCPELVAERSAVYHSSNGRDVHSIMYATIGLKDRSLLIRAINDSENPKLPFIRKFTILREFARDLSPILDAERSSERHGALASIRQAGRVAATPSAIAVALLSKIEAIEGVESAAVLLHQDTGLGMARPSMIQGPVRDANEVDILIRRMESDKVWLSVLAGALRPQVLRRQDHHTWADVLHLPSASGADIALLPVRYGSTSAILAFPVWGDGATRLRQDALWPQLSFDFLHSAIETMAYGAERILVGGQASIAMEALALIGHEMSGAASSVTNLGLHVLDTVHREKSGAKDPISLGRLAGWRSRFQNAADELEAHVQLGYLVGRRSGGRLIGVMKPARIGDVISVALAHIEREKEKGFFYLPDTGVRLQPMMNADWGLEIQCDRPMITAAIQNVLRNAVKYSVQGKSDAPCVVNVRVARKRTDSGERLLVVRVENQGVPIPSEIVNSIFLPFVRGTPDASLPVSLRGMGLGLYLALAVARSHRGNIVLAEHVPAVPGYGNQPRMKTAFELTLSADLPGGPYDANVEEWDARSKH